MWHNITVALLLLLAFFETAFAGANTRYLDEAQPDWYVNTQVAAQASSSYPNVDRTVQVRAVASASPPPKKRSPPPRPKRPPPRRLQPRRSPPPRATASPYPPPKAFPQCVVTPGDVEGPFFQRSGVPLGNGTTKFCKPSQGGAAVKPLFISGYILDSRTCQPLNGEALGIILDVWQADNAGGYDDNFDLSDSNCRTRLRINPDGSYRYTTIMPAAYGPPRCLRPPHIHLHVSGVPGFAPLTTQMYFAGDPLNGPADCGCSSCGSGRAAQQVQLDSGGAGAFNIVLRAL